MEDLREPGEDRLDALITYVPDSMLDKAIAQKKTKADGSKDVRWKDIMALMRLGDFQTQMADMAFDSYAMRLLVYQQPSNATLLSSLMTTSEQSLHRVLVKSGEEQAVLTVAMQLQEGLVGQYRSAPKISPLWRLKSIGGEPEDPDLPSEPSVSVSPEQVVAAQLEALKRKDIAAVFAFASPRNKQATGPLERFSMLLETPMYKPLLGHVKAESLRKLQITPETYAEVVGIVSPTQGSSVYVWSVGRVLEEQSEELKGCWMTNNVQLVSASGGEQPWMPPPRGSA